MDSGECSTDGDSLDDVPRAPLQGPSSLRQGAAVYEPLKTTVMLRNISSSCHRTEVCELLDAFGLAGRYDYVHVPMLKPTVRRPWKNANFGYCFVNLLTHQDALWCKSLLEGQPVGITTKKVCTVQWAAVQVRDLERSGG